MPATPQFISRINELVVVLEPEGMPIVDERGVLVAKTKGHRVHFRDNAHTARDAKEAELLRQAKTFNSLFYEVGNEPGRIRPSVEEMAGWITDAATRRNVKKLRELKTLEVDGDGEQGGHSRPEVLAGIDRALAILTDGKEGKLGPGRPHPIPAEET